MVIQAFVSWSIRFVAYSALAAKRKARTTDPLHQSEKTREKEDQCRIPRHHSSPGLHRKLRAERHNADLIQCALPSFRIPIITHTTSAIGSILHFRWNRSSRQLTHRAVKAVERKIYHMLQSRPLFYNHRLWVSMITTSCLKREGHRNMIATRCGWFQQYPSATCCYRY